MSRLRERWLLAVLSLALIGSAFAASVASSPQAGRERPAAAVSVTLHGNTTTGWGWASTNVTTPGPTLNVNQGDVITFTLFADDSMAHTLVIDVNSNGIADAGEQSTSFASPTSGVTFVYNATASGAIQYFCGLHGASVMRGTLSVRATPAPPGDFTLVYAGIGVGLVVIVGAAAAVMRRRKKTRGPGEPPKT